MNRSFPQEGILAALALPVDGAGNLVQGEVSRHLAWLCDQGIHGLLVLGSSGEFPYLSIRQRKEILNTIAELAPPIPIIANISDIDHRHVAELGRHASSLHYSGVAVMPPFFYPVADRDQYVFFAKAAEAARLPVLLYNFPERTGNRIALETISRFADNFPLAGIKQSGAEFSYHQPLIALGREKNFSVFSGSDLRLPEVFSMGAAGCIGGLVNCVPELMVGQFNVCRLGLRGSPEPAATRMQTIGALVNRVPFPLNVAVGMQARGFYPGEPKGLLSKETRLEFEQAVTELREKFLGWGMSAASAGEPR